MSTSFAFVLCLALAHSVRSPPTVAAATCPSCQGSQHATQTNSGIRQFLIFSICFSLVIYWPTRRQRLSLPVPSSQLPQIFGNLIFALVAPSSWQALVIDCGKISICSSMPLHDHVSGVAAVAAAVAVSVATCRFHGSLGNFICCEYFLSLGCN